MGRNLMAHLRSNLTMRLARAAFAGLPTELETSALFVKGRTAAGRHFHIQVTASGVQGAGADSEAELFKKIPDVDFFETHKLMTDDHVVITLRGIGEMRGERTGAGNAVRLDPEADEYGAPRAFVQLGTSPDGVLWNAMDQAAIELSLAIADGHPVEYLLPNSDPPIWQPQPPPSLPASQGGVRDGLGTTHHEAGTLWMGEDPTSSVTDDEGRIHDVPNAYVAGPALFPMVGSPNPMLTGVALARRTAERSSRPLHRPRSSPAGYYTVDLAEWIADGKLEILDIQPEMLEHTMRRVLKGANSGVACQAASR